MSGESASRSRLIAIEEHFLTPAIEDALGNDKGIPPSTLEPLRDLEEQRIAVMDEAGIDMQLLLHTGPGVSNAGAEQAPGLARTSNDELAALCARRPDRFAGLALLPAADPDAAADELERGVRELGLKGGLFNGTVGGRFLDDPMFDPVFARAAQLEVPLYLHPSLPDERVADIYYGGFSERASFMFAGPGWGWHIETGVHLIRLVLAGVFDRHPSLQLVTGHLGQGIPFFMQRIERMAGVAALQRPIGDYFLQNIAYGTTGFVAPGPMACALEVFGADRLMFAADYPYHPTKPLVDDLENLGLEPDVFAKISHLNAERVFNLEPLSAPVTAAGSPNSTKES